MKVYSRIVTKRVKINRFGKLGYRKYMEYVMTADITPYNKGKHIKFYENEFLDCIGLPADVVYEQEIDN